MEKTGLDVIRQRIELIDKAMFSELENGDILFIDSSHVIRPQGDVLFEYLELLPVLKPGVIVHIHDIFSPKDYLKEWVIYLYHSYYPELKAVCPFLTADSEPRSFYIQKIT